MIIAYPTVYVRICTFDIVIEKCLQSTIFVNFVILDVCEHFRRRIVIAEYIRTYMPNAEMKTSTIVTF